MSVKTKIATAAAATLLAIGLPAYGLYSMQHTTDSRVGSLEQELQTVKGQSSAKIQEMSTDLDYMADKMEITKKDLAAARKLADTLKKEQVQTSQRLRSQLEINAQEVTKLRADANTRLDEVQQDTTTKIGAVSGDVQTVKVDLDATKSDLASSRREMGDMRDNLGRLIAHNSSELNELRRRGERDYLEFDVRKTKDMERLGDIRVQLEKTDVKKQKYDLMLLVDDSRVEKKDRTVNEPVTFLVGRDRLRYEFVVNYVDKDRIRGYISTPKDKLLAAEGPSFRTKQ